MEELKVYETFERKDIEEIIKGNIKTVDEKFAQIAPLFVRTGYYLRRQFDEKMYQDAGFDKFEDYVKETYGKSRSWAKRMMQINEKFSVDGNSPLMDEKFVGYSVSHLQEMIYLTDEQLEEVNLDMTVKEIREIRNTEEEEVQEEPVSILGYPLKVYPEDSLIATPGCGNQDCFSCHRDGCELRQADCYCVEAPMANPFPCTTINVVDMLREEIGSSCQFVNEDLTYHRKGDGQPVPCCKSCNNKCGYACNRSKREEPQKVIPEEQNVDEDIPCDVAQDEQLPGKTKIQDCPGICPKTELQEKEVLKDSTWFVKKYFKTYGKSKLREVEEIFKKIKNNGERAKAVCRLMAHYGYSSAGSYEFSYTFRGFASGIEFESNDTRLQMKYGRFVVEIESIYGFRYMQDAQKECATSHKESMIENEKHVLETAEIVIENADSVIETAETVIEEPEIVDEQGKTIPEERIEELTEEATEDTDIQIVKKTLEKENRMLHDMRECYAENDWRVRRQKLLVGALANFVCELEEILNEEPEQEQPELPVLKNNDQRKEFIDNYMNWPIWLETKETGERYYRYNFENGTAFVVKVYYHRCFNYAAGFTENLESRYSNRYRSEEYYLLMDGKFFKDCLTNRSALVEHMKNVQRNGR